MKWPFRRKQDVSVVPAEIQEYYQTERRERTGIAWLLALGTLIITIGLATALFFGGRWIYQTVFDNDDTQKTAQTDQGQEAEKAPESKPEEPAGPSTGTSSTNTSTPNNPSTTATPTQSATAPSPGTRAATTAPAAGDLPNTGPGDTLAVFVTITAVSAIAYEFRRRYFA